MAPQKPTAKASTSSAVKTKATGAGVVKRQRKKGRRIDHTLIDVEPKTSEFLQM